MSDLSEAEKAAILDWLLTPAFSGRSDRPDRIDRSINRNAMTSLFVFRVWGTKEEFIAAARKEMAK